MGVTENFSSEFFLRNRTNGFSVGFNVDQEMIADVPGSDVQLTRRCLGTVGLWVSAKLETILNDGEIEIRNKMIKRRMYKWIITASELNRMNGFVSLLYSIF